MQVKLFELRDRATFIPVIAIRLHYEYGRDPEQFLLRRAGYAEEMIRQETDAEPYILFGKLDGGKTTYDPFAWGDRTMATAHAHAINFWQELTSGDVIDVEYLLGETPERKVSERLS